MVPLSAEARARLFEVARAMLGAPAETLVRDAAWRELKLPLEQVTYAKLRKLVRAIEESGAPSAAEGWRGLAADIRGMAAAQPRRPADAVVAAVRAHVGGAAAPLLARACEALGISQDELEPDQLDLLAEVLKRDTRSILGDDAARALASAVSGFVSDRSRQLTTEIQGLVMTHLGPGGDEEFERLLRGLDGGSFEPTAESLEALAQAIDGHAAAAATPQQPSGFATAAWKAISDGGAPLRRQVLAIAAEVIGPFAGDFVQDACRAQGVPFDLVDAGLLVWLTDVLYEEVRAFASPDQAERLKALLRRMAQPRAA